MSTNRTAELLGPEPWAGALIELSSVHGLWGGHIIRVAADGAAVLRLVDQARYERRYSLALPGEAAGLLRLCVEQDVAAQGHSLPPTLLPDTAISTLRLRGAGGEYVVQWGEHDRLHPALQAVRAALLALRARAQGAEPEHQGPFEW